MSDFGDDFYRENILDHYKSPRNYGELEHPDAHAEGMNPLCGDETAVAVKFAADGETIQDIRFVGRGCAISMASTSMLTELVKGRKAADVASMSKDELLEDLPPLTPVRLKCALLGLSTLRVALHKGAETPLPEGLEGLDELELK